MQFLDGRLVHSASDLNAYTECHHLVTLESERATGLRVRPLRNDPTADLLARKGLAHEQHYLATLRERYGADLVAFEERPVSSRAGYVAAERDAVAAMERGAPIIYQPTFFDQTFLGRADFLRRVEHPCARWNWSYEVIDTKLALSPKPYFLIQLCNYSEHLERISGTAPEAAAIVLGSGQERRFRVSEYAAYYRRVKTAYVASIGGVDVYPVETTHCDMCLWQAICAAQRDADDHLSLVADIRHDQIRKLEFAGISTLGALAIARGDVPRRLNPQTYKNLGAQAAEQHTYRTARAAGGEAQHSYSFRNLDDDRAGFARLPEPAAGDIFFDMEGDPLYSVDRPLEYLFGIYLPAENTYRAFWGTDPQLERVAFEDFVDFLVERQRRYPNLHVYHYAPYETTALKRLMGGFGSHENEIDAFLRAQIFVDLYPVVKQSIWISQPSYSLKKLEALYGFERRTQTRAGDDSIVMFESWLENNDATILEDIRAYNEDDCRSTFLLREWLVRLRGERNATLPSPIPWRPPSEAATAIPLLERSELGRRLLAGLPQIDSLAGLRTLDETARARWLLGNLLEYHRREQKPEWWEHFNRLDHTDDFIDGDRKSLGGLELCHEIAPYKRSARDRSLVYSYTFPEQDHDLGQSPLDAATGKGAGDIVKLDDNARRLTIKLTKAMQPDGLRALIPRGPLDDRAKRDAIETIAAAYDSGTLAANHPATCALLYGNTPRLRDRRPGARLQPDIVSAQAVSSVVASLAGSYLVVQGPPGTGKTTIGAYAIVDLLASGKRVALAAQSHKALHNLLRKVEQTAEARNITFRGCHKSTDKNIESTYESCVAVGLVADAPKFDAAAGCALVSATTFSWANDPSQRGAYDFVIIDEAGQISLADALVTSLIARNVVLLGDPQQLPQVSQGFHPVGSDRSILEHLLDGAATIAVDRGIFLETSYRMHPQIDRFVSDAFYDGRLRADGLNARNAVHIGGAILSGTRFVGVAHDGNARRSVEEADCIINEIVALLRSGTVTIRDQPQRRVYAADILVVTPYNAQRVHLLSRLEREGISGVAVGTVDKFQGQEAPIVFYSLTVSSAEDAPRGLEFLLSPNRFNVAVSRAQALSVLVCNPQLLTSRASTTEHMRLLNLLCTYVETARYEAVAAPAVAGLSKRGMEASATLRYGV